MQKTILIGLAGLVGTLGRYWLTDLLARHAGERFPWGTLFVNLLGCLLAGCVFYWSEERFVFSPNVRAAILIGLLGGLTTFSAFGLQTFLLLRDRQFTAAVLNLTLSNFLGLLMVWTGYSVTKIL
jgi:CrcB protein